VKDIKGIQVGKKKTKHEQHDHLEIRSNETSLGCFGSGTDSKVYQ
jgi:hypothetical protein